MTPADFIELTRDALFVMLLISLPPMMVALVVGLLISLFQALTQIQEATLTFVPKIIALVLTLVVFMPFIVNTMGDFTRRIAEKIVHVD